MTHPRVCQDVSGCLCFPPKLCFEGKNGSVNFRAEALPMSFFDSPDGERYFAKRNRLGMT